MHLLVKVITCMPRTCVGGTWHLHTTIRCLIALLSFTERRCGTCYPWRRIVSNITTTHSIQNSLRLYVVENLI